MFNVNEIFTSIQGEGFWTGTPMCFVRLSGCNLSCSWCDTEHDLIEKLSALEIVEAVESRILNTNIKTICITGGEPTIYNLAGLTELFTLRGFSVHLETNGTRQLLPTEMFSWITVSPKFPPGLSRTIQHWGDELKLPVWAGITDEVINQCLVWGHFKRRYLQPVEDDQLKVNVDRCIKLASINSKWTISTQAHKRLGLR